MEKVKEKLTKPIEGAVDNLSTTPFSADNLQAMLKDVEALRGVSIDPPRFTRFGFGYFFQFKDLTGGN
jgi:hypothetical protein